MLHNVRYEEKHGKKKKKAWELLCFHVTTRGRHMTELNIHRVDSLIKCSPENLVNWHCWYKKKSFTLKRRSRTWPFFFLPQKAVNAWVPPSLLKARKSSFTRCTLELKHKSLWSSTLPCQGMTLLSCSIKQFKSEKYLLCNFPTAGWTNLHVTYFGAKRCK